MPVDSDEGATQLFSGTTLQDAELVVVAGTFKGKKIGLGAGTVIIGRSSECDLVLRGAQGVSRRHCKVQYLGNRFVVVDLESRNGTIVNGQSVERKVLEGGDVIEVGDEHVKFVVSGLDDLRQAPFGDGGFDDAEDTGTIPLVTSVPAGLPSPYQPPDLEQTGDRRGDLHVDAVDAVDAVDDSHHVLDDSIDDSEHLKETLPPTPAMRAAPTIAPSTSGPPPATPVAAGDAGRSSRSKAPLVFALLALLVIGGGGFLVYDVLFSDPAPPDPLLAAADDAGTTNPAAPTPDAPTPDAPTPDAPDAPTPEAPIVDAGAAPAEVVVDAGTAAPTLPTPPADSAASADAIVVTASSDGRLLSLKVKVGDVVKAGAEIATVTSDNGTMERKLQALKNEERQFEAAARADPAARADLDDVRREMRRVEARLTPKGLKSDQAGTVTEVLVAVGDTVKAGDPLLKVRP